MKKEEIELLRTKELLDTLQIKNKIIDSLAMKISRNEEIIKCLKKEVGDLRHSNEAKSFKLNNMEIDLKSLIEDNAFLRSELEVFKEKASNYKNDFKVDGKNKLR